MDETPLLCMSPLNHATTSSGHLGMIEDKEVTRLDQWGPMLLRPHKMVNLSLREKIIGLLK